MNGALKIRKVNKNMKIYERKIYDFYTKRDFFLVNSRLLS